MLWDLSMNCLQSWVTDHFHILEICIRCRPGRYIWYMNKIRSKIGFHCQTKQKKKEKDIVYLNRILSL